MNWSAFFAIGAHVAAVWLLYLAANRFMGAGRAIALALQYDEGGNVRARDSMTALAQQHGIIGSVLMLLAVTGIILVEVAL